MKPAGTAVSERFRDTLLRVYPALSDNWRYLAFLDLIAFGGFIESKNPPALVVTHRAVLGCLGMSPKTSSKKFQSGPFIAEFNRKVVGGKLTVGPYSHLYREARTLRLNGLEGQFFSALDREFETFHLTAPTERVHLVSGERCRPTTAATLRSADLAEATAVSGTIPEAKRLIHYMNGLPVNVFTSQIRRNMPSAIEVAKKIPNAVVRRHQLALLHRIALQPQPFYGGSTEERTVRIFARNPSLLQLRNEVKKELVRGFTTFDLKSAHLSIIAKDWNVEPLLALLDDESTSVWKQLARTISRVSAELAKAPIKTALYAIAFGGGAQTVRFDLERALSEHIEERDIDVTPFFEHVVVKELLRHRKRRLLELGREGGTTDCFGRRLRCETAEGARSVLAQLSQAQELKVLLPALTLAETRPNELRIVIWEHDGFSVHFRRDPARNATARRALVAAVNNECSRLGYRTALVEK